MFRTKIFVCEVIALILTVIGCEKENSLHPSNDTFLGQIAPGTTAIRFADHIITDHFYPHSKLILSPEGDKIYWTTFLDTIGSEKALYYSDFDGENLSAPMEDTALDEYGILSFVFSGDQNNIMFGSLQPYDQMADRPVRAVWTSAKSESGWSRPQPIESTLDTNWASLGSVSYNYLGDIYFSGRMQGETAKIYCSQYVNGQYLKFEPLPEIINTGITLDPFIDFQDQFLIFAAANRTDNTGIIDLYISLKNENGNWSQPSHLGQEICTQFIDRFPMVTRDAKYLFFVTSHANHFPSARTHFYWVDAGFIEDL